MLEKIKKFIVDIIKKLDSLFKVTKKDNDWSNTSFLSFIVVVVPILVWTIMCFVSMAVLSMPESIVALIIVGITGKVLDKNNKLKNTTEYIDEKK